MSFRFRGSVAWMFDLSVLVHLGGSNEITYLTILKAWKFQMKPS